MENHKQDEMSQYTGQVTHGHLGRLPPYIYPMSMCPVEHLERHLHGEAAKSGVRDGGLHHPLQHRDPAGQCPSRSFEETQVFSWGVQWHLRALYSQWRKFAGFPLEVVVWGGGGGAGFSCNHWIPPCCQLFLGFGFPLKVNQPKNGCRFFFPMEIHWASEWGRGRGALKFPWFGHVVRRTCRVSEGQSP